MWRCARIVIWDDCAKAFGWKVLRSAENRYRSEIGIPYPKAGRWSSLKTHGEECQWLRDPVS